MNKEFDNVCQNREYKSMTIYGGTNVGEQIQEVNRGVEIVVGTPGRLLDLLSNSLNLDRGVLNLQDLQTIILDEAD